MNDMTPVIQPKSDQLNADSLLSGPITVTVAKVSIRPGTEQPISIHYDGDDGKPYKPCKSMARVMVACWGADASKYTGRSMTLYCDPEVKWAGMAVGGIRISHMSHIDREHMMALTASKGNRKPFRVLPLTVAAAPTKAVIDTAALTESGTLEATKGAAALQAWWATLTKPQQAAMKPTLDKVLKPLAAKADAAPPATPDNF